MIDAKRITESMLGTVRAWIEPAFQSLQARLDDFDTRLKSIPHGPAGKDGVPGLDGKPGLNGIDGHDGRDADPQAIVLEVERQLSKIPMPRDGLNGKDGLQGERGPAGANGRDAEPVHPDTIARLVNDSVRVAVRELPLPKDGKDGKDADPAFIEQLVRSNVVSLFATFPKPQDGAPGERGADGKDGERGADGSSIDPALVRASIDDAIGLLNREFVEMADELLRGLGEDSVLPALAPSLNLQVNAGNGDSARRSTGLNAREQSAIGSMIASTIRDTLMLPVKPVYDAKGTLLYGQRVASVDQQ
jgi:hypothetical protein